MTPIPNGFNLERLVVLVRHGARTTLSQAKVLQPQEWIMKNLINTVSIMFIVFCFVSFEIRPAVDSSLPRSVIFKTI